MTALQTRLQRLYKELGQQGNTQEQRDEIAISIQNVRNVLRERNQL